MDDQSRIALVRVGNPPDDTTPAVKFHLGDHLGSSNVVIDEAGNWVNREEYTPYGETSFGSFARKRYRFTGKERDEESGLNYHGARYYAPWLGRWISCDPIGLASGLNLYDYVRGNPVRLLDSTGLAPESDNICTSPHRAVSSSANKSDSPQDIATTQVPKGGNSSSHSPPITKSEPKSESNPVLKDRTHQQIEHNTAPIEATRPERNPPSIDTVPPENVKPKIVDGPFPRTTGLGWRTLAGGLAFLVMAAVIVHSPDTAAGGTALLAPAATPAAVAADPLDAGSIAGSPSTPAPPASIANLPGIQQANQIFWARHAMAEANRVGLKIAFEAATVEEMNASKVYLQVLQENRGQFGKAGTAFHDALGLPRRGIDRIIFGTYEEVKTKNPWGVVSGEDMLKGLQQAESYRAQGPHTLTYFDIGAGNKFVISR
jgi:RHS repeat-associated protein